MANEMPNTPKPVKMWIDGKIFQIQLLNNITRKNKSKKKCQDVSVAKNTKIQDNFDHLNHLDITETDGKFSTNIKLPEQYYRKLLNHNFHLVAKTELILPKSTNTGGLMVQSESKRALLQAVTHIHSAISEIRLHNIPMQFTCIPCLGPNILERFDNLKKKILALDDELEGLDESIFISPLKLHVTIDVYALLDEREKEEAVKALREYEFKFINKTEPPKLEIRALECMGSNVEKTDVIYAKVNLVNETDKHNLQRLVNDISDHFYHKGLAKKQQENVKIHMTIINTKYRRHIEGPKRKWRRQSIDATKILERFGDYEFGQCDFDSVHLSQMMVKGEDGFYKPLAVLKLSVEDKCDNENKEL